MQSNVWECGNHQVHLNCGGYAVQFESLDEFHEAIVSCQDYIEYRITNHQSIEETLYDYLNPDEAK